MKRSLPIIALLLTLVFAQQTSAQRYLSEVFSSVNVTYGKAYGANYSFLISPVAPYVDSLRMDVYEPAGDTLAARPMIIYLHTGSFLPVIQNGNPTGYRGDSATVEMCKEFARRGYVAVSMSYRAGWNPLSSDQDTRTGSLLQAVYRALQDTKTCVRYFKMNAKLQGNTFKVDTSKIVLGGQGSGGYVVLGYATLHNYSQITLEKFIAGSAANAPYHWDANSPYVDQTVWGDFEGIGGDPNLNITNWPGYSTDVKMVFNMGGALGDSSWIEPGMVPMVCFHVTNDPFAPYSFGNVIVPFFNYFVVSVAGSREVIRIANEKGNNDVFNMPYNDPYTTRANQVNEGFEGLFPFILPDPSIILPGDPYHGQAGPWEWWDSTDLQNFAPYVLATSDQATTAYESGFYTNPDMSKSKGMAYIDSVQGYLAPRMAAALELPVGINETHPMDMLIHSFPNPAADYFTIRMEDPVHQMQFIQICDPSGRVVKEMQNIHGSEVQVSREGLSAGLYLLRIGVDNRIIQGKMIFE